MNFNCGSNDPGKLLTVLQLVCLVTDNISLKGPKIIRVTKHLENGNYVAYFYTHDQIKTQRGELICSRFQVSGSADNETKNIQSGHRLIISYILYSFSRFCSGLSPLTT